jgi:hypothetical protein
VDRYFDRPEKRAEVDANVRAWERLKAIARAPSVYAGRVPRAHDSFAVRVMLHEVENAMRSLDRTAQLRRRAGWHS